MCCSISSCLIRYLFCSTVKVNRSHLCLCLIIYVKYITCNHLKQLIIELIHLVCFLLTQIVLGVMTTNHRLFKNILPWCYGAPQMKEKKKQPKDTQEIHFSIVSVQKPEEIGLFKKRSICNLAREERSC